MISPSRNATTAVTSRPTGSASHGEMSYCVVSSAVV
ncbi:Uncharacterised protein [Bordetella pertussis]|nr:Uncharacterised protein [Bordetella pertussis]CFW37128.1 Uncharacterised protein [Bordetella pertussis]